MDPNDLWVWFKAISIPLGGFAGVMKVIELFLNRPKIIGEVELFVGGRVTKGGTVAGAHLMMLVYLVNKRIRPTTVKAWHLEVSKDGKNYVAEPWAIPLNFTLCEPGKTIPIDFDKAVLYDIAAMNLLEYGKGIRGWLRFFVPGMQSEDLQEGAKLKLTMTDALAGKHVVKHRTKKTTAELGYLPGAGVKVT